MKIFKRIIRRAHKRYEYSRGSWLISLGHEVSNDSGYINRMVIHAVLKMEIIPSHKIV